MQQQKRRVPTLPYRVRRHSDTHSRWLEVSYLSLLALQLTEDISEFSHRDGNVVYLDEDHDWEKFQDAYTQAMEAENASAEIVFEEVYDGYQSFIRNLDSYYI